MKDGKTSKTRVICEHKQSELHVNWPQSLLIPNLREGHFSVTITMKKVKDLLVN